MTLIRDACCIPSNACARLVGVCARRFLCFSPFPLALTVCASAGESQSLRPWAILSASYDALSIFSLAIHVCAGDRKYLVPVICIMSDVLHQPWDMKLCRTTLLGGAVWLIVWDWKVWKAMLLVSSYVLCAIDKIWRMCNWLSWCPYTFNR